MDIGRLVVPDGTVGGWLMCRGSWEVDVGCGGVTVYSKLGLIGKGVAVVMLIQLLTITLRGDRRRCCLFIRRLFFACGELFPSEEM
jgi:hypothetical protein